MVLPFSLYLSFLVIHFLSECCYVLTDVTTASTAFLSLSYCHYCLYIVSMLDKCATNFKLVTTVDIGYIASNKHFLEGTASAFPCKKLYLGISNYRQLIMLTIRQPICLVVYLFIYVQLCLVVDIGDIISEKHFLEGR